MANRQVVARLNELEGLVSDAARRRIEAGDSEPPVAYVALRCQHSNPTPQKTLYLAD